MQIRTVRCLQELETLRKWWEEWQNHPNNDFTHFQLVCQLRSDVLCPHVAVVESNGKTCALLLARIERTGFAPAIGYFQPVRIPATVLTVIYKGLIGQVDDEVGNKLVGHLRELLSTKEADAVVFSHLPENSMLFKALLAYKTQRWRKKETKWNIHWDMDVPQEHGFIFKKLKSKHRSWIRGREKKLSSAFPGKVSWRWINRFDDLSQLLNRLEELASRTYHRGLRAGFIDDEEHRQRFSLFASRGQLRIQVLEIEGKIRAFWIGTVYRNIFYSSETAYDPELSKYEPGTLVFLRMVDELVREGIQKFDFGLGDAHYKQRYGEHSWNEVTIRLFAPSAKGLALKVILGLFDIMDETARCLLQKTGFLDRLKGGWRRYLASARQKKGEND